MGVKDYHTQVVGSGFRMSIPTNWPPGLEALIREAWDADNRKRPNFSVIVDRLEDIKAKLEASAEAKGGCCIVS